MPQYRSLRLLVACLVGGLLLVSGVSHVFALQVGDKPPDFTLPSTTAEAVKLADYLEKKPVVLFFYIGAFTKT